MGRGDRGGRLGRRAIVVGAAALALGMPLLPAPSVTAAPLRTRLLAIVNEVRTRHDLRTLRLNVELSADAKRHTRRMIRRGELLDVQNLAQLLEPYRWDDIGAAVVGCHETLRGMVRGWLREPLHRALVLHPDIRRAGIGVVRVTGRSGCGRDRVWATAIVYG